MKINCDGTVEQPGIFKDKIHTDGVSAGSISMQMLQCLLRKLMVQMNMKLKQQGDDIVGHHMQQR